MQRQWQGPRGGPEKTMLPSSLVTQIGRGSVQKDETISSLPKDSTTYETINYTLPFRLPGRLSLDTPWGFVCLPDSLSTGCVSVTLAAMCFR